MLDRSGGRLRGSFDFFDFYFCFCSLVRVSFRGFFIRFCGSWIGVVFVVGFLVFLEIRF